MDAMILEFPLEAALVMLRGIEVGIGFAVFSLMHCMHLLFTVTPISAVDFWLFILGWLRLVCAIPRPLYWQRTRRELKSVRRGTSPQEVGRRLQRFHASLLTWSLETYLLYTFYAWLGVTLILTGIHDSDLSRALWKHCWLNLLLLFLHRVLCVAYFFYLTSSDLPRGLSQDVLDAVSSVYLYESGRETVECGICYAEYEQGESIRKLPCNHHFHKHCVDPWLTNHQNKCPLCLTVLEASDKID